MADHVSGRCRSKNKCHINHTEPGPFPFGSKNTSHVSLLSARATRRSSNPLWVAQVLILELLPHSQEGPCFIGSHCAQVTVASHQVHLLCFTPSNSLHGINHWKVNQLHHDTLVTQTERHRTHKDKNYYYFFLGLGAWGINIHI